VDGGGSTRRPCFVARSGVVGSSQQHLHGNRGEKRADWSQSSYPRLIELHRVNEALPPLLAPLRQKHADVQDAGMNRLFSRHSDVALTLKIHVHVGDRKNLSVEAGIRSRRRGSRATLRLSSATQCLWMRSDTLPKGQDLLQGRRGQACWEGGAPSVPNGHVLQLWQKGWLRPHGAPGDSRPRGPNTSPLSSRRG